MIAVCDGDGEWHEFPDATRVATDEHNNLEIWCGRQGDKMLCLFHRDRWQRVEVDHDRES